MNTTYYIGADVHNNSTELAIEKRGKIVARYAVPTTIPAISNVLDSLQGAKHLAIEEGPMAGRLYRNLNKKVDKFIAADPRRNKLISSDGKISCGNIVAWVFRDRPVEQIKRADQSRPDYNFPGQSTAR